jgi:flagellar operon protein
MIAERVQTPHVSEENGTGNTGETSFSQILADQLLQNRISFSKHAQQRLEQREISMTESDLCLLDSAIRRAEEKGVHNSLVLMEDKAFIVNVQSGTVITAMDKNDLKEQVFTQIDGAVIA